MKILHVKPQHCHGLVPTHTALGVPSWEPVPPDFTPLGLFGTGIQSYFTFLRFLLLLNLLTLLMTASFVLLPLVWLRHPEPGPALKLSECWNCPDPCAPQLRGLALDSSARPASVLGRCSGVGRSSVTCVLGTLFCWSPLPTQQASRAPAATRPRAAFPSSTTHFGIF